MQADKPKVIEFVDHFEARNHIRISPHGVANAQTVVTLRAEKDDGAGLAVQWADVKGPPHDTWPPESHRRIFGDLPQARAPAYHWSHQLEIASKAPEADAERVGRNVVRRAVTDEDVKPGSHSCKNLFVRLADGGFKHGQHLAFDPKTGPPLSNLYVSMLQRLGIDADKFGSSAWTLTGLKKMG